MLILKNPHSVLAALETRPSDVIQVSVPNALSREKAAADDPWARVTELARAKGIKVTASAPGPKGPVGGDQPYGRQGGAEAQVKPRPGLSAEELFGNGKERVGGKGLWLALDCLQDPQNVGAIFRTAAFFGVQGVLMTQERSAPLSAAAYDVASGGLEHVPFTIQPNLQRGFEVAKDCGLWILGTSEHASQSIYKTERDRPWLLVLGNEEKGMRRLTSESCDLLCAILPAQKKGVTSLNVSVAAGILIGHLGAKA